MPGSSSQFLEVAGTRVGAGVFGALVEHAARFSPRLPRPSAVSADRVGRTRQAAAVFTYLAGDDAQQNRVEAGRCIGCKWLQDICQVKVSREVVVLAGLSREVVALAWTVASCLRIRTISV